MGFYCIIFLFGMTRARALLFLKNKNFYHLINLSDIDALLHRHKIVAFVIIFMNFLFVH